MSNNLKVGFAIPRRDVVIELTKRFKTIFENINIIEVYGGCSMKLASNFIILTTHQLYRYENYFDLLIVDEIDAFPFYKNEMLYNFFKKSIKGNYILMSATPDKQLISVYKKTNDYFTLFERFHQKPLPIPKIIKGNILTKYLYLFRILYRYFKSNTQCFIFLPTIHEAIKIYKIIRIYFKQTGLIHSSVENRSEIISLFKDKKLLFLVTTTVLERGVTFSNLQVIVFNADHVLFTKEALIQIAGRVGRKMNFTNGDVYLICEKDNEVIKNTINEIKEYNKIL